jgi:hypothetical protein
MNLFSDIESLRGENLASAMLRYLIINSSDIREEILELIDIRSPVGPLVSDSHFSCYLEEATVADNDKDDSQSRGRIDVVIELDNAIVGIEAKFHAGFQQDQPFKYFPSLEEKAKTLKTLRGVPEYEYFLCVLLPESRINEVSRLIAAVPEEWARYAPKCKALTWTEVRVALERAEKRMPAEIAYLSAEFREYLDSRLTLFTGWARKKHHTVSRWQEKGTTLQIEVLEDLFQVIDAEVTEAAKCRLARAADYVIQKVEVTPNESLPRTLWYGFCRKGDVSGDTGDGAEFFIVTTATPSVVSDTTHLKAHGPKHGYEDWTDRPNTGWTVNIEEADGRPEFWSLLLNPFTEALLTRDAELDENRS